MQISVRALITALHGMGFGALFLLMFSGALIELIWLLSWFILSRAWQGKKLSMGKINVIAFLFLGAGFLLSFPPIGDLLQGK